MTQYVKLDLVTGDVYTQVRCRFMETQYEDAISEWGVFDLVAGEALAAKDLVFVSSGQLGGTKSRVYKASTSLFSSTYAFTAGFTEASAAGAASAVRVRCSGIVTGLSGLTAGIPYYASATPGLISSSPLAGSNTVLVGIALSTTTLLLASHRLMQIGISPVANSITYGYMFAGGTVVGGGNPSVVTDRLTLSTGIMAARTLSDLPAARWGGGAVTDRATYAYHCGGHNGSAATTTGYRFTLSTEVFAANTGSNLSTARFTGNALSDGATYGYMLGGWTTIALSAGVVTADRITFSTSVTAANAGSNLTVARGRINGYSDPNNGYGYTVGGINTASSPVATADRTTFSTSATAAHTAANYSSSNSLRAVVGDGLLYAWWAGGEYNSGNPTDRLTLSTGVMAARSIANLTATRYAMGAISDITIYGYMSGGVVGAVVVATSERMTFSTETFAANTASAMSVGREYPGCITDFAVAGS